LSQKHPQPHIPQHAPHAWTISVIGKTTQYSTTDNSPLLDEQATKQVQAISGTFLNQISNQQAKPTEKTMKACRKLMDYLCMHPKAVIRSNASDIILSLVSDAAYLVLPDARS